MTVTPPPEDFSYIAAALLHCAAAEVDDTTVAKIATEVEVIGARVGDEEIVYIVRWRGHEYEVPVPASVD